MTGPAETVHATCVAIGEAGVLVTGPSGAGKSDLALRLIDRGAHLVADDYTDLRRDGDRLVASVPATIAGMIEARGLGILAMLHRESVTVALVVALDEIAERMPERLRLRTLAGVAVPVLSLAGFEASSPIKVELALNRLADKDSE